MSALETPTRRSQILFHAVFLLLRVDIAANQIDESIRNAIGQVEVLQLRQSTVQPAVEGGLVGAEPIGGDPSHRPPTQRHRPSAPLLAGAWTGDGGDRPFRTIVRGRNPVAGHGGHRATELGHCDQECARGANTAKPPPTMSAAMPPAM